MRLRHALKYVLYAVVLAGVVGGTVAWSRVDKTVSLRIDEQIQKVHTTSATVQGVLADAKVSVGVHDILAPTLRSKIHDGSQVVLRRGRLLHLRVDGQTLDVWVTTPTVAEALDELGYSTADFSSVSRDQRLPLTPTDIELRTPRTVTVVADGVPRTVTTTDATVAQVLSDLRIAIHSRDRLSVPINSWPTDGSRIVLQRVTSGRVVERQPIPFTTTTQKDPSAPVGQTTVVTPGRAGIRQITYAVVYLDGKLIGKTEVSRTAVLAPQSKLVKVGTKQPTPTSTPTQTPAPTQTTPISVDPSSAQGIARQLLADRGMGDDQFNCLVQMWNHESGWRVDAENPSSGAYGIPQALPGSKMAAYGADWRTNPRTQILWGLNYIQQRYGTPCQAWALWQQQGWY